MKYAGIVVAVVLVVIMLHRGRVIDRSTCKTIKGKVAAIYPGGLKEVILRLSGEKVKFVLQNSGNEQQLQQLKQQLQGREVRLRYAISHNPLEPAGSIAQVEELTVEPDVLYPAH